MAIDVSTSTRKAPILSQEKLAISIKTLCQNLSGEVRGKSPGASMEWESTSNSGVFGILWNWNIVMEPVPQYSAGTLALHQY